MRLPDRAWIWLVRKEWRELLASRAWWLFLVLFGPLVGVAFISAATTYAEASGLHGTAAGVGEAFSPLVGIWAPTFSACELAATFLLPFIAIRLVAGDRLSGALKLELQHPGTSLARVMAKSVVLVLAWLIASLATAVAIALWSSYGGHIYGPELATVVIGHLLNAGLTIALAVAAAACTAHPSTAAIVTLAVTVGSWILSFIAAVHGGWWERAAAYTPTAMVAEFQHGLVRLAAVLIAVAFILTGLGLAAVWLRVGVAVRRRTSESALLLALMVLAVYSCTFVNPSWDLSENRMNSFSLADEQALRQIHAPLRIEAHLAPEDPRRSDLEQRALSKLRRIMPRLQVEYVSSTTIGLFEQSSPHYGEIIYELAGHRSFSRVMTEAGVLEAIYALAGMAAPDPGGSSFRGYPLPVPPRAAAVIFYAIWPAIAVAAGLISFRRRT